MRTFSAMGRFEGKAGRAALLGIGLLAALAVAQQVALPRIAASRISSRVGRYGHVQSVSVSAWPAIELLWGQADSVTVRAGSLSLSPQQAASLLWEGRGVSRMELRAATVRLGSLQLRDASLSQRGGQLTARAQATKEAVGTALPLGVSVSLLGSGGGKVEVLATGQLFGVGASVQAVAEASKGRLVAHPLGLLLEGFQLTLFANDHVSIEGVGATASAGGSAYALTMTARLR
jgi:hypothetical protein